MSPGKLAAQVAHASMAYFINWLKINICLDENGQRLTNPNDYFYFIDGRFPKELWDGWIDEKATKTIVEAKNKNQLKKAIDWADEHHMIEGFDYFLIKDACLTELQPEEVDGNGNGRTLTCIGFRPLPEELANELSHKFHLYAFGIENK